MLTRFWKHTKRLLDTIGNFQTRLLLTVFYIVLVIPTGLIMQFFSDPLRLRPHSDSAWRPKNAQTTDSLRAHRQF